MQGLHHNRPLTANSRPFFVLLVARIFPQPAPTRQQTKTTFTKRLVAHYYLITILLPEFQHPCRTQRPDPARPPSETIASTHYHVHTENYHGVLLQVFFPQPIASRP